MKQFFTFAAALLSLTLSAQWDTLNINTDRKLVAIAFDGNIGYAVGNDVNAAPVGQTFITFDRGNTWSEHWSNDTSQYRDIAVSPGGWWWVVGDDGYYWSHNMSITAAEDNISSYSLRCGAAPDDSVFYAAGEHGLIFRTVDLGNSWDTITTSGTFETINDIYFSDVANGWIIADGGYLATTSDSGSTWNYVFQAQWGFTDFRSIAYQDLAGLNPYIVGENGSGQFSIDGGTSWYAFATGTTNTINKIGFIDPMSGFMVGENGYINRSIDGGASWFGSPSSENVDFYDIAFADDTTAFICGDSGVILRSRNDISSIQQQSTSSLAAKLYPNPSSGPLFAEVLMRTPGNVTVSMYDLTGQVISNAYHENVSEGVNRFELNTETLAAGIYYVQIAAGDAVITMPYIRQ
jgi:photosystem II stability/assembly factor-like uncharacterized protein